MALWGMVRVCSARLAGSLAISVSGHQNGLDRALGPTADLNHIVGIDEMVFGVLTAVAASDFGLFDHAFEVAVVRVVEDPREVPAGPRFVPLFGRLPDALEGGVVLGDDVLVVHASPVVVNDSAALGGVEISRDDAVIPTSSAWKTTSRGAGNWIKKAISSLQVQGGK